MYPRSRFSVRPASAFPVHPPRRLWHPASLALALTLGGVACTEPDGRDADGRDRAGRDTPASLDGGDGPLALEVRDIATVGALDGADWETFSGIRGVDFDAAGNLYIFDFGNHRVVVTDSAGRHLRTMGAEGDGPGELRNPNAFAVGSDGTVAIGEMPASFEIFGPTGEYLRSFRFETEDGFPSGKASLTDGRVIALGMGAIRGEGSESGEEDPSVPVRAFHLGSGTDTILHRAWAPRRGPTRRERIEGGPVPVFVQTTQLVAFRPRTLLAVLPDGRLVVADSTDWALDLLDPDGTLLDVLRRPIDPVVVTPEMREAERQRQIDITDRVRARFPGEAAVRSQLTELRMRAIEDMRFEDVVPVILWVGADPEGRIWVARQDSVPGEPGSIDIVTAEGDYLGTIPPSGPRPPAAFGPDGLAAYIERDEYDVERVVIRRVLWPEQGR